MFMSMFLFSFAMSITPGPVNTVILSTSINYGLKKTISYISGATIGFVLLLIFIGFGLHSIFVTYPFLLKILAIFGALFVSYIGYKIMFSDSKVSIDDNEEVFVPGFRDGFLLQWLNPKAWLACISGTTMFSSLNGYTSLVTFIIIYFITCYVCLFFWGVCGDRFALILNKGNRMKYFNMLMGGMLIISAISIIFEFF
ncbi:LysE family translocator [Acinetobacter soli]|uniref:LysE family translocator n=1 Tax=Acinetobacter soli TaxID=487316 RepID=UPI00148EFF61|nr:LysE family translocator [Acinetobacter soli]